MKKTILLAAIVAHTISVYGQVAQTDWNLVDPCPSTTNV